MPDNQLIGLLAPLIFVGGFAAFWIGVMTLVGRFSGWNKIAAAMPPGMGMSLMGGDEKVFRYLTLRVGMSNYKGCVTARTTRHGLSLNLWKMFSFGHQQPLFIPWNEIDALEPQTFLGFANGTAVQLKQDRLPNLILYGRVFENNIHIPLNLQTPESQQQA